MEHRQADLKLQQAMQEVGPLKKQVKEENIFLKDLILPGILHSGIIAHSPSMKRVKELTKQVTGTNSAVLITSETGTGKELIAWTIHQMSKRNNRIMITIDCE
ncbi:MAG: sigma 54-interacting transcriptional regulator [Bacteroidales bacterium]|nr:sigma 54-interacting transcriptional regulator [Lentimicrobiaceae bacterium]MDD5694099.1 sigma 54-interacting transcriptional regulator [Bacteroidales bacterium]